MHCLRLCTGVVMPPTIRSAAKTTRNSYCFLLLSHRTMRRFQSTTPGRYGALSGAACLVGCSLASTPRHESAVSQSSRSCISAKNFSLRSSFPGRGLTNHSRGTPIRLPPLRSSRVDCSGGETIHRRQQAISEGSTQPVAPFCTRLGQFAQQVIGVNHTRL